MFTAIIEYWREDLQRYSMEVVKRPTRLAAMQTCRKSLKTGFDRPGHMPECARVEDSQENVVARYEVEVGRVILKPLDGT